jgi:hypothetical protein
MSGNLIIRPLSAKLTRDTETFGKMDPFCVIHFGGQRQQTQVAKDAGKFPSWNECFSFRRNAEDLITVEVWDQDGVSKNDMIGQGSFALASVVAKAGKSSNWVQLSYKGKDAGQVLLEIEFYPDEKKAAGGAPAGGVAYGAYPGMPMGGVYPVPMMPMGGMAPGGYMPMPMGAMPMGGYAQPPAGYGYPPAGGYQAPGGYAQPPAGYQAPAGGYQAPAGGYQAPGGYAQPPAGYAQPPAGGYQQPPAGYGAPGGYPQQYPPQGYPQYPPGYK